MTYLEIPLRTMFSESLPCCLLYSRLLYLRFSCVFTRQSLEACQLMRNFAGEVMLSRKQIITILDKMAW